MRNILKCVLQALLFRKKAVGGTTKKFILLAIEFFLVFFLEFTGGESEIRNPRHLLWTCFNKIHFTSIHATTLLRLPISF